MAAYSTGTVTLPVSVNLYIRRGADCRWGGFSYVEKNEDGTVATNSFSGWTVRSQIRRAAGGTLWHTMTVGSGITITAAANKLTVYGLIPHAVTESLAWDDRTSGEWDVEIVRADGTVVPFIAGSVKVSQDITRL